MGAGEGPEPVAPHLEGLGGCEQVVDGDAEAVGPSDQGAVHVDLHSVGAGGAHPLAEPAVEAGAALGDAADGPVGTEGGHGPVQVVGGDQPDRAAARLGPLGFGAQPRAAFELYLDEAGDVKRAETGGKGLDGVIEKAKDYFNPFLELLEAP